MGKRGEENGWRRAVGEMLTASRKDIRFNLNAVYLQHATSLGGQKKTQQ